MSIPAAIQTAVLNPWLMLILWILMILMVWFCLIPALKRKPNNRN